MQSQVHTINTADLDMSKQNLPAVPSPSSLRSAGPEGSSTQRLRGQHGFTLIELLVTVSVLVAVLGIGIPSFRDFIERNTLAAANNVLMASLNTARAEAVKRRTPVAVCTSTDGQTCTGGTNWAQGWIVFANNDRNSPPSVGVNDTIIQVEQSIGQSVVLNGSHALVQYDGHGRAKSF
jgi:type IV fimbrial biogenesis protein FimT